MIHGSFGTLGILTKLTFRLVPAKPYVRVRPKMVGMTKAQIKNQRVNSQFIDGDPALTLGLR